MILFVVASLIVLLTVLICSFLLWRYPIHRRPNAVIFITCIVLGLSATTLTIGILATNPIGSKEGKEAKHNQPVPCVEADFRGSKNASKSHPCSLSIVPRSQWVKSPLRAKDRLKHPVEFVFVSSTQTSNCPGLVQCSIAIHILHYFHEKGFKCLDVGYNFFVGGDGQAYENRGWDIVGDSEIGMNETVLGISLVGTFATQEPPSNQIKACISLIREGVRLGKISSDYKIISDTENAGQKLYDKLQKWNRWDEAS